MKHNWILPVATMLALLLVQGSSWAERWEFLGKHPEGKMYLDSDSISRKGEMTTFWTRRMYDKPQESKISKMKFQQQLVQQELDCRRNTMNMTQMLFLDAKGKGVAKYQDMKETPKHIQPGGFFDKEAKMLCPATANKSVAVDKHAVAKAHKSH